METNQSEGDLYLDKSESNVNTDSSRKQCCFYCCSMAECDTMNGNANYTTAAKEELRMLAETQHNKIQDNDDISVEEIVNVFHLQQQCNSNRNNQEMVENAAGDGVHWEWKCAKMLGLNLAKYKENGKTVEFHPYYAYGTAAVRANLELTKNTRAFWEVMVNEVYGTSIMFGIGTKQMPLSTPLIFDNLLGGSQHYGESYGLSHHGVFFNGSNNCRQFCEAFPSGTECRVGVVFDGPGRRLGYSLNGRWLGWVELDMDLDMTAPDKQQRMNNTTDNVFYYPMVSSTAQRSCFTLLRSMYRHELRVKSLQEICEDTILTALMDNDNNHNVDANDGQPFALRKICCCNCSKFNLLPLPKVIRIRLSAKFAHLYRRQQKRWQRRMEAARNNRSHDASTASSSGASPSMERRQPHKRKGTPHRFGWKMHGTC